MYPEISSIKEASWYRVSLIFPNKLFQTLEQGICVQTACWSGSGALAAKPCPGIVQGKSLLEQAKIMPGNITGVNDAAPVPGNLPKHAPLHWDRCRPSLPEREGHFCSPAGPNQPSFDFHSVNPVPSGAKIMSKEDESHLSQSECQAMWGEVVLLVPSGNVEVVREKENSHHANIFT